MSDITIVSISEVESSAPASSPSSVTAETRG